MEIGILQGKIDNQWRKIADIGITTATTSVSITGLNGERDMEYMVYPFIVNAYNGTGSVGIRMNADNGAKYSNVHLYSYGTSTTVYSYRSSQDGSYKTESTDIVGVALRQNDLMFSEVKIEARKGKVRKMASIPTGVGNTSGYNWLSIRNCIYDDATTDITGLEFIHNQSNGIGAGSRIIVMARQNFGKMQTGDIVPKAGKGCFVLRGREEISTATNSIAFTNLKGDAIYKIIMRAKNDDANTTAYSCILNADTNSNYYKRFIDRSGTTLVTNYGSDTKIDLGQTGAGSSTFMEITMLSIASKWKVAIVKGSYNVSSSSTGYGRTMNVCYDNDSNNIGQIELRADQTSGFGVGSVVELWQMKI